MKIVQKINLNCVVQLQYSFMLPCLIMKNSTNLEWWPCYFLDHKVEYLVLYQESCDSIINVASG